MNNYKGVVLFDIDGTLTTGLENEKVVQYFLDRGYAVGISTAGSLYTPENLKSFSWMPNNLYNFMKKTNFNTFNNVMSNIIIGKYNPSVYRIPFKMNDHLAIGWRKAKSMEKTAELYRITDPEKIIILDNDPIFIRGIKNYNPKYTTICAGKPCTNQGLSMATIEQYYNSLTRASQHISRDRFRMFP
tara:strand:+ start:2651 stop:3211 length:561 start_codon:yes stop_codon:yes gene_type:complete